jgi:hypothetical protein
MPQFTRLDPPDVVLTGADVEPTEEGWLFEPANRKQAYYQQLAVLMRDGLYRQLFKGIGANGARMKRRKYPRADGGNGPVLSPHWSDSRFRTHMRWEATGQRARIYWLDPWASIVSYHARGLVRGAPVRNVIGLCEVEQEVAIRKARKWYAGQPWANQPGPLTPVLPVAMGAAERELVTNAYAGFGRAREALGLAPIREMNYVVQLRVPIKPPSGLPPFVPARPGGALPERPPVIVAPPIPRGLSGMEVEQRFRLIYEAAGRAATTDPAIDQTIRRLGAYNLSTLHEVAFRVGINPIPNNKADIVELLRRTLDGRLREARRLRGGGGAQPPRPNPVPPRPPITGPARRPVADALTLPAGPGGKALSRTHDAIGKVHSVGKLPKIPTRLTNSTSGNAAMVVFGPDDVPVGIEVSRLGERPEFSYAHEIGHLLDRSGIPGPAKGWRRGYKSDPHFKEWFETIEASQATKALANIEQHLPPGVKPDHRYTGYLLRQKELWARSYAQYIATRSNDPVLREQLDAIRNNPKNPYRFQQWSDEDFEPIAAAIDRMFKALGWLP